MTPLLIAAGDHTHAGPTSFPVEVLVNNVAPSGAVTVGGIAQPRKAIGLIAGSGVSLTVTDDATYNTNEGKTNIAVAATGTATVRHVLLGTVTLASGQSSMSFSAISQSYKHLVLRWMIRSQRTDSTDIVVSIQFNSDTGTNYATVYGQETLVSWTSTVSRAVDSGIIGYSRQDTYRGDNLQGELWIHDYTSASTYKQCQGRSLHGSGSTGGGYVDNMQVVWWSTSAITGIRLFSTQTIAIAIGAVATLWGVTA